MILARGCWARTQGTSPPPLNVLNISSLNMALKNDACIFSLVSLWGQDLRHRKLAFIGSQTLQVSVLYLLWFAAVGIASGLRPWALFDSLSFDLVSRWSDWKKEERILLFARENIFDIWWLETLKCLCKDGGVAIVYLHWGWRERISSFQKGFFSGPFLRKRDVKHTNVWEVNCGQLSL